MKAVIVVAVLAAACFARSSLDCPSFVKKDDVTTGNQADIPDGWYVYADCDVKHTGATGLYRASNRESNATKIPNTDDGPGDIDITGDGEWILYFATKTQKLILIRPNGDDKTEVPTPGCTGSAPFGGKPRGGGLYRKSPYGLEIHYLAAWDELRSTQVDLSGDTPKFGESRTIVKWGNGLQFQNYGFEIDICVVGAHVYSREVSNSPNYRAKAFFTIPDDGKGTATADDRWQYTDLPKTSIFGCGFTMSHDGTRIASGYGAQGTACIPCHASNLDHKGFVVEKFREPGETRVSIHDIDTYGVSVNYCPEKYRFGKYNEVDFSRWYWSNNDSMLVGTFAGTKAPDPGVWLVNWVTNTWTKLTAGNMQLFSAAIHFDVGLDSKNRVTYAPRSGRAMKSALQPVYYDMRGRMLPHKPRTAAALPAGVYFSKTAGTMRRCVLDR